MKGLLAAAGPESLIIATIEGVRQAYTSEAPQENGAKQFTPLATIAIPRISQLSFSTDGSCLVIAAEEGGGLAVYDTQALQQGQSESAFQLATNGIPVRALVPNPAAELSHLFAVILAGGQLLMADLKDRKLVSGSQGSYFREGVSCVSWSTKGKQMVAGLEDGTAAQFDHQGNQKAIIPAPSGLSPPMPVTSIYWLANDDFLTIHTPVNSDSTDSVYHLMHRDKATSAFTSSKFAGDPTPAFGLRHPAHHFISRLKSFPPNLDDMLIVSSTAGTDIGVFSRSTVPLSADVPADEIINRYTLTGMTQDSRRAQMPMSADGMGDTSPIGMALDLSSKDNVKRPLPSDDMEETSGPVPALMILDNEGRLSTWWVMYTESIRQRTVYPGLTTVQPQGSTAAPSTQPSAFQSPQANQTPQSQPAPAFGSSTFGQPNRPAFGSTSTPGFGSASNIGSSQSPWGSANQTSQTAPAFGKPAFGSSTPFGASAGAAPSGGTSGSTAFGSTSGLGNRSSPWAAGGSASQSSGPAFGQASQFGASTSNNAGAGFAKFGSSSGSPFGAAASSGTTGTSPFAVSGNNNNTSASPFSALGSGAPAQNSPFAAFAQNKGENTISQSSFGSGSAFASNKSIAFGQTASGGSTGFGFGQPSNMEASAISIDMMDNDNNTQPEKPEEVRESIEKPTPQPSAFGGFKLVSGFKGDGTAKDDLPQSGNAGSSLFGTSFGNMLGESAKAPNTPEKPSASQPLEPSATPASPPKQTTPLFNFNKPKQVEKRSEPEEAPLPPDFTAVSIKKEPTEPSLNDIPLPPDPTSKTSAPAPKAPEEAPLPPDFLGGKPKLNTANDLPPLAGSPPVNVERASSDLSPIASDDDDHDLDEEGEDGDDLDGEVDDEDEDGEFDEEDGDWEDETGVLPSDEDVATPEVTQQKIGQASTTPFGSRLQFPSALSSAEKPFQSPLPSTTPAGLPKGPIFAPPQKESPRSPSPIRSISTPAVRTGMKQVANQPVTLAPRPQANTSARPATSVRSQKAAPVQAEESDAADLNDDEDARIRAILNSEIQPTKVLDPFIAHQDYVGGGDKPGLGGQIENIYRDINSMVDTLGLNARALEAFVRGQSQLRRQNGRTAGDLDQEDDWCLVEVEDLNNIEDSLGMSLEEKKLRDIPTVISNITSLLTDTVRLRTRVHEIRRQITLQADPDKRAAQRNAPLDTDTELKQSHLRQLMTKTQKLLQEVEEQSSVLRAELVSVQKKGRNSTDQVPTVEAVTNTIMKMTAMIEQKSGDVDVLEAQIRRLPQGLGSLSLGDSDDLEGSDGALRSSVASLRSSTGGRRLPASRSLNILATPAGVGRTSVANRRSMIASGQEKLGLSGMLGSRFRTPPRPGTSRSMISLTSSVGGVDGFERRRIDDEVSPEEIETYNTRAAQRRRVLEALRQTVESKGTRIVVAQGS